MISEHQDSTLRARMRASARHTKITVYVEMVEKRQRSNWPSTTQRLEEKDWGLASTSEKYKNSDRPCVFRTETGDDGEAYSLIERACDICPDHKSAKRNLATSKLLQGKYEQARELAGKAVQVARMTK